MQETSFPDGDSAKLTLTMAAPKRFTLAVRRPVWAGDAFVIKVNGAAIEQPLLATLRDGAAGGRGNAPGNEDVAQPSTFVNLEREWKTGDTVELTIPKTVRLEPTPDNKSVAAIMWGPLVLAGDWGPRRESRGEGVSQSPIPVLVAAERPVNDWVVRRGAPGDFQAQQVAHFVETGAPAPDVTLKPFYRTDGRTYSVYFDVITPTELNARTAAIGAERERCAQARRGDDRLRAGRPDSRPSATRTTRAIQPIVRRSAAGRLSSRGGTGWFSYDLPADPTAPMAVVVTYFNDLGLAARRG